VGTTTVEAVAFVMGVIDGLVEIGFDAPGVVAAVELYDLLACDWLSDVCPTNDEAVGDCIRDEDVDN
jgi:hypothetical protein